MTSAQCLPGQALPGQEQGQCALCALLLLAALELALRALGNCSFLFAPFVALLLGETWGYGKLHILLLGSVEDDMIGDVGLLINLGELDDDGDPHREHHG